MLYEGTCKHSLLASQVDIRDFPKSREALKSDFRFKI